MERDRFAQRSEAKSGAGHAAPIPKPRSVAKGWAAVGDDESTA